MPAVSGCSDIAVLQNPDGNAVEQEKEGGSRKQKRQQTSGEGILCFVCIHSGKHQGIWPVQTESFIGDQQAENASDEGDTDWYGEAADHHGQQKLQCADRSSGERSAQQPECDDRRRKCRQADQFSADDKEKTHPELRSQCNAENDRKFPEIQA